MFLLLRVNFPRIPNFPQNARNSINRFVCNLSKSECGIVNIKSYYYSLKFENLRIPRNLIESQTKLEYRMKTLASRFAESVITFGYEIYKYYMLKGDCCVVRKIDFNIDLLMRKYSVNNWNSNCHYKIRCASCDWMTFYLQNLVYSLYEWKITKSINNQFIN